MFYLLTTVTPLTKLISLDIMMPALPGNLSDRSVQEYMKTGGFSCTLDLSSVVLRMVFPVIARNQQHNGAVK